MKRSNPWNKFSERRSPKTPTTWKGGYIDGPGWSRAHQQRLARKRRNVMRNRRAHRG
jgi:hypothetical protein